MLDTDAINMIVVARKASVDRYDRERKSLVWGGAVGRTST
jgi:hypothetical protein